MFNKKPTSNAATKTIYEISLIDQTEIITYNRPNVEQGGFITVIDTEGTTFSINTNNIITIAQSEEKD